MIMNIDPENAATIIRRGYSLPWKRLQGAAILAAIIHLLAGIYTLTILHQGLGTAELSDRLVFLASNNILWLIGWMLWLTADFSILYFYCCFIDVHKNANNRFFALLRYALFIAVAGFTLDLIAEVLEMNILPELAQGILSNHSNIAVTKELFSVMDRLATMLTGFLANGLYSIAAGMLIFATKQQYPPLTQLVGWLVVISGLYLSIACFANSVPSMVAGNAVLLPFLIAWLLGIAWQSRSKN